MRIKMFWILVAPALVLPVVYSLPAAYGEAGKQVESAANKNAADISQVAEDAAKTKAAAGPEETLESLSKKVLAHQKSIKALEARVKELERLIISMKPEVPTPNRPRLHSASRKTYGKMGKGHWVSENINSGEFIKLEDKSLWQIRGVDKIYSMQWLPISRITVAESRNSSYPYMLINTVNGERVEAKLR